MRGFCDNLQPCESRYTVFSDLFVAQPREVPQFDDPPGERILGRETSQRFIQGQQVFIGPPRGRIIQ